MKKKFISATGKEKKSNSRKMLSNKIPRINYNLLKTTI